MRVDEIASCAQLACLLEAAAPKPGNVNRYHDFEDATLEHFLASAVALRNACEEAAKRGHKAGAGELKPSAVGIGTLIKEATLENERWHRGRNTNLGIALLLIPLSAAAGVTIFQSRKMKNSALRENLDFIIRSATYKDAAAFYEALIFLKPRWLGSAEKLDASKKESIREIKSKKIAFHEIMKLSRGDSAAQELVTKMKISFELGYPALMREYLKSGEVEKAVVRCFLEILARVPDSLIARKLGLEDSEKVTVEARKLLRGGVSERALKSFDKKLRRNGNKLNPGTTADLTTSSLMIALLNGLRP